MAKRRGRSEGSLYERPDGLWVGAVSLGVDPQSGRRIRKTVYGHTKTEVKAKLQAVTASAAMGLVDPSKEHLRDYLERWLETAVRPATRANTYVCYRDTVRRHIVPRIGGVRMPALSPVHVQGLLSTMEADGCSPRLRQLTHAVLRRALNQALRWNLVLRNPVLGVVPPRVPRTRQAIWTAAEGAAFLAATRGDRLENLYVLALHTGMREGELLGLQWADVDLTAGTVRVQTQLTEVPAIRDAAGAVITPAVHALTEPKTQSGVRCVTLSPAAVAALRAQRTRLAADGFWPTSTPMVFPTGSARSPRYWRKSNMLRAYAQAIATAGLPRITFHALRHTHATVALDSGVELKTLQTRLGHSSLAVTGNLYTQTTERSQRDAADRVGAAFSLPRT